MSNVTLNHHHSIPFILKTGVNEFDSCMPHYGFAPGQVTQLSGPVNSGKSQICFHLTVQSIKEDKKVLYIDTKSAFSATRVVNLLRNNKIDRTKLNLVHVAREYVFDDLLSLLISILTKNDYTLVILDSLPAVFEHKISSIRKKYSLNLAFDKLKLFTSLLAAMKRKYPALIIIVTTYEENYCIKTLGPAYSLSINLTKDPDPFQITRSAYFLPSHQEPSVAKFCQFQITEVGLKAIEKEKDIMGLEELEESFESLDESIFFESDFSVMQMA